MPRKPPAPHGGNPDVKTSVEFPEREAKLLEELASMHGQSVAEYVESVLHRLANAHRTDPDATLEEAAYEALSSGEGSSW